MEKCKNCKSLTLHDYDFRKAGRTCTNCGSWTVLCPLKYYNDTSWQPHAKKDDFNPPQNAADEMLLPFPNSGLSTEEQQLAGRLLKQAVAEWSSGKKKAQGEEFNATLYIGPARVKDIMRIMEEQFQNALVHSTSQETIQNLVARGEELLIEIASNAREDEEEIEEYERTNALLKRQITQQLGEDSTQIPPRVYKFKRAIVLPKDNMVLAGACCATVLHRDQYIKGGVPLDRQFIEIAPKQLNRLRDFIKQIQGEHIWGGSLMDDYVSTLQRTLNGLGVDFRTTNKAIDLCTQIIMGVWLGGRNPLNAVGCAVYMLQGVLSDEEISGAVDMLNLKLATVKSCTSIVKEHLRRSGDKLLKERVFQPVLNDDSDTRKRKRKREKKN